MWMWHQRRDIIWHPDACKCHPGYCWFYVSSAIHSDSLQFALCRSSQLCSASASVMKHVPGRAVCRKPHWRCCFVKLIRIWDAGRVWEVKSLELVQICTFFRKILRKFAEIENIRSRSLHLAWKQKSFSWWSCSSEPFSRTKKRNKMASCSSSSIPEVPCVFEKTLLYVRLTLLTAHPECRSTIPPESDRNEDTSVSTSTKPDAATKSIKWRTRKAVTVVSLSRKANGQTMQPC